MAIFWWDYLSQQTQWRKLRLKWAGGFFVFLWPLAFCTDVQMWTCTHCSAPSALGAAPGGFPLTASMGTCPPTAMQPLCPQLRSFPVTLMGSMNVLVIFSPIYRMILFPPSWIQSFDGLYSKTCWQASLHREKFQLGFILGLSAFLRLVFEMQLRTRRNIFQRVQTILHTVESALVPQLCQKAIGFCQFRRWQKKTERHCFVWDYRWSIVGNLETCIWKHMM